VIISGQGDPVQPGRTVYPLEGFTVPTNHFVVRETRPDNPFPPHCHEEAELWYVIEGEAVVSLNGKEHSVVSGDLVRLDPWVEHGLSTSGFVRWICIG
jgi:mannose-6-phosphate isomerase-like protein (cupin superfamily)